MEGLQQGLSKDAKRSIDNFKEHNREDAAYRMKLVANKIIKEVLGRDKNGDILEEDKKDMMSKSDYDRVREIAFKMRVSDNGLIGEKLPEDAKELDESVTEEKFIEDVRGLAMVEFALKKRIKIVEVKPTSEELFKEFGLDLSELVSELMFGNPDKAENEICINIARVSLDEFVLEGVDSTPYFDRVLDKISERFAVAPEVNKIHEATVTVDGEGVVQFVPKDGVTSK